MALKHSKRVHLFIHKSKTEYKYMQNIHFPLFALPPV